MCAAAGAQLFVALSFPEVLQANEGDSLCLSKAMYTRLNISSELRFSGFCNKRVSAAVMPKRVNPQGESTMKNISYMMQMETVKGHI